MRRLLLVPIAAAILVLATASAAFACGSLIGPNGAVHLVRTSTLAAWHGGVEHYVTNFEFASNQTSFGSIIPLPAEPTTVERGGDWTLQRLARESRRPDGSSPATSPRRRPAPTVSTCSSRRASTRSTSRSCAAAVRPSPTGPRSRGSTSRPTRPRCSSSTPTARSTSWPPSSTPPPRSRRVSTRETASRVHLTIPVERPWVPLRILGTGKPASRARAGRRVPPHRRRALRCSRDRVSASSARSPPRARCSTTSAPTAA